LALVACVASLGGRVGEPPTEAKGDLRRRRDREHLRVTHWRRERRLTDRGRDAPRAARHRCRRHPATKQQHESGGTRQYRNPPQHGPNHGRLLHRLRRRVVFCQDCDTQYSVDELLSKDGYRCQESSGESATDRW